MDTSNDEELLEKVRMCIKMISMNHKVKQKNAKELKQYLELLQKKLKFEDKNVSN